MLHMPTPMLMAPSNQRTHAEWQAHVITLAVDGFAAWTSSWAGSGLPQKRYTTAAALSGDMYGTTWGPLWSGTTTGAWVNAPCARAIQHALPDADEVTRQTVNGFSIYFETANQTSSYLDTQKIRNGYASLVLSDFELPQAQMPILRFWDGVRAWEMQPSLGVGPLPYDW